jgi:hypothetical protein
VPDRVHVEPDNPGFCGTPYALLSSLFALPGRLLASQSGWIVEAGAEAARAGGVMAPFAVLFTGLPVGSYGARADPAALGAGYLIFFLYSSLLGVAVSWEDVLEDGVPVERSQPSSSTQSIGPVRLSKQ